MALSYAAEQKRLERLDRQTELIAAFILSIATLTSSYAGFQAQLWDGEQAAKYTLAEQARTNAASAESLAGEGALLDTILFSEWLDAYARDNTVLQDFYRQRFRPEFMRTFDAWVTLRPRINHAAPSSPFHMPGYMARAKQEMKRLSDRADGYFAEGERANDNSDAFVQATLILALALFLGGIIQAFKIHWLRLALLGVGALCCVVGIARIAVLPALRLTLGA